MGRRETVYALDLEPIIIKSIEPPEEEGLGLTLESAKELSDEYRKFLLLTVAYPEETIVPSTLVDKFWHLHILDTAKYAKDCEDHLGRFIHHFPYFGMRGEQDAQDLRNASARTLELYREFFGSEPPSHIWVGAGRCPNCGRRVFGSTAEEVRPSFEMMQIPA